MRYFSLLALGSGQAAAILFANSSTTAPSKGVETPKTQAAGLPDRVGDFQLYGCSGSSRGFPTFKKVATTPDMTLDFCAASCPTRFMGVYNTDCYCGDELDPSTTVKFAADACNNACPGGRTQSCGGRFVSGGVEPPTPSQQPPIATVTASPVRTVTSIVTTVSAGQTITSTVTSTLFATLTVTPLAKKPFATPIDPNQTITKTITSTITDIITSCPPDVANCRVGSKTTEVSVITTEICPVPEWHKKKLICYGDYCAPETPCDECERYRVICEGDECRPERCSNGEESNKLVICKNGKCSYPKCQGNECEKKIVCFDGKCAPVDCYGDECQKKLVCKEDKCKHESCSGDECYKKIVCQSDQCKPQPPCKSQCPVPPPPGPKAAPYAATPAAPAAPFASPAPQAPAAQPAANAPAATPAPQSPGGAAPAVQVGGSDKSSVALNLLGAAAGLAFML